MWDTCKKPKLRNTRNSQRLYNLQQQELLYKELGVSAMSTLNPPKEGEEREENEDQVENRQPGEENQDSQGDDPDVEGNPLDVSNSSKRGKKAKRTHSISTDSDSESGKVLAKKRKKNKEKGKASGNLRSKVKNGGNSSKQGLSKNGSGSPGSTSSRKSLRQGTGKVRKNLTQNGPVSMSQGPVVFPQSLMVSSDDSNIISAHMNAYTKFLLDNNLHIPQQQLSQSQGPVQQNPLPIQQNQHLLNRQNTLNAQFQVNQPNVMSQDSNRTRVGFSNF